MKKLLTATIATIALLGYSEKLYNLDEDAAKAKDYEYLSKHMRTVNWNVLRNIDKNDYMEFGDKCAARHRWDIASTLYFIVLKNEQNRTPENIQKMCRFIEEAIADDFTDSLTKDKNFTVPMWKSSNEYNALLKQTIEQMNKWFTSTNASINALCRAATYRRVYNKIYRQSQIAVDVNMNAFYRRAKMDESHAASAVNFGNDMIDMNDALNDIIIKNMHFLNDSFIIKFASDADRVSTIGSTKFREYVYENSTNCFVKYTIAIDLKNPDKIVDALKTMKQDTFNAQDLEKMIPILNGQPANWRNAEILEVLKNVNSMYTLKLYDDRDAWEPVLSKIRAMIDVRQQ